MSNDNSITLGYSYSDWQMGVKTPFIWHPERVPHLLISGLTGGGKTVLAQTALNQLLNTKAEIFIADYKAGGDWDGIVSGYGEFEECGKVLNHFYEAFIGTIQAKEHREMYLLWDEFSSYALSRDSKQFKELMSRVSHIAFMGRSFGYHLILVSQQFNAKVIDTAVREQFGIKIYMGSTISTESATMLFPNCEIDKSIHLPMCCGYISLPEKDLDIIQIPFIDEPEKLKKLLITKGSMQKNID